MRLVNDRLGAMGAEDHRAVRGDQGDPAALADRLFRNMTGALELRGEPPARVADLACGTGWSSIAMAQAYPLISVDGFDLDADAIRAARGHAEESGLADRVTFTVADASGPGTSGGPIYRLTP